MRLFPHNDLKRTSCLAIAGIFLLLIAGCNSPVGEDRGSATATAPIQETIAVGPTAGPTATQVVLPSPMATPTATEVPAELAETGIVTGPVELIETASPVTSTLTAGVEITATEATTGTVPAGTTPAQIDPAAVNGLPVESIIVMPVEVQQNVREIFARGQVLGRNAHAFSKLGDSLIATPSFLTQFDAGFYDLAGYDYLQPAIDYYAGSFERYGVALRPGLHAWGVFDPLWADKDWCQANENLLACEFRLNNPSVVLVLLGTNDAGNPPGFDFNMRKVIEFSIENGVIPIIVTKADRFEGPDNINNNILRQIAADYQVPLWDFDLVADTLPGRGLKDDKIHLTVFVENDYNLPEAFQTGTGIHNLTGLMALDAVRQAIME